MFPQNIMFPLVPKPATFATPRKQNIEYIIIDSPLKKGKTDEIEDDFESEITEFINSDTHKKQI